MAYRLGHIFVIGNSISNDRETTRFSTGNSVFLTLTNRENGSKMKPSHELKIISPGGTESEMHSDVQGAPQRRTMATITTRTFGRYRLERRIAYGGMAEILLASDLRMGRLVALKRILPHYAANPEFVQYFIHEGRLGQRLRHPNLVETYEAGQVGETCYIALEYLRGATAIELLRAAARAGLELPLGAAVRVVADAARGLHYAHCAADATGQPLNVVHRDVTPHNLFVCADGSTKVLDFGIAKAASQLHHTRTGTIKGKFSYLAPEQVRGEPIDRRVDVFALGIVLHELLTLKPLFRGTHDADTLQRILTLDVPPPEKVRHAVPPGLGAVALRALMRDRERRLPSAEALADSIEAVAEAECIDASREVVAQLVAELCPPLDLPVVAAREDLPEPPERDAPEVALPALTSSPTVALSDAELEMEMEIASPATAGGSSASSSIDKPRFPTEEVAAAEMTPAQPDPFEEVPTQRRTGLAWFLVGLSAIALGATVSRSSCLHLASPLPSTAVQPSRLDPPPPLEPLPPLQPEAAPAQPPPAVEAARVSEAKLRVLADGSPSFTVDGKSAHPGSDGALHLAPGRHKVVVSGERLAAPRTLEVELRAGEATTRAVRSGRGSLRLAVTPWAEVVVDGRPVGTTPLSPVELGEGAHWVSLKNGELATQVKRRVVVAPERETLLRVDLFSEKR
jgi:serine/threonine-protein kinase